MIVNPCLIFLAQALLPYYMHLIATTLFCKITFLCAASFLSMLDFIFSTLIMDFVIIQKQAYAGIIEKKEDVAEKREKMALFT